MSKVIDDGSNKDNEGDIVNGKRKSSALIQTDTSILYDRQEQQQALRDAYYRSKERSEMVIITGPSGTGKTALANTLAFIVEQQYGGLFLRGKFDPHMTGLVSPCLRAFQFYAKLVLAKWGKLEAQRVRKAIEQQVGVSEIHVLLEMIPELGELLTPDSWQEEQQEMAVNSGSEMDSSVSSANDFGGEFSDSQARAVSVFRRFLRGCSSKERPLVLALDDLQVMYQMLY